MGISHCNGSNIRTIHAKGWSEAVIILKVSVILTHSLAPVYVASRSLKRIGHTWAKKSDYLRTHVNVATILQGSFILFKNRATSATLLRLAS